MPKGDVIGRLVAKLGGSSHPDRYKPGGWHFRLWGGEIKLWGSDEGRRHWFRKGPHTFVVRRNFGNLLGTVVSLGLGRFENGELTFHLTIGGHPADDLAAIRKGHQGFTVIGQTPVANHFRTWRLGRYLGKDFPEAWSLFLGTMTHGEWRPLVDHLMEADPDFADKWAAFEAARKEVVR